MVFSERGEHAGAGQAAAGERGGILLVKIPVAGRRIQLALAGVEDLEAQDIGGPHQAFGPRVLAEPAGSLEAGVVGQRGHFLPHVPLDPRQQQDARRQILRDRRGRQDDQQQGRLPVAHVSD